MKKLYFLLLISSLAGAQVVNFTDPNFKSKLLTSSQTNFVATDLSGSYFAIDANNDGEIQVAEAQQVRSINVSNSNISSLNGVENFFQLGNLSCNGNLLTTIDLSGLTLITGLYCQQNQLTSLNLGNNIFLSYVYCTQNQLTTLDLSDFPSLSIVDCSNNNLSVLNILGSINIVDLKCNNNPLTSLDLSQLSILSTLNCEQLLITSLNCQNNSNLTSLYISGNLQLETLFIKNGSDESTGVDGGSWWENFANCPNLQYICADDNEITPLQLVLNSITGLQPISVTSYCSFTPGGDYNTITGMIRFDSNGNGCSDDTGNPFIKININDGSQQGSSFTDTQGNFNFYVGAGDFNIAPDLENPNFFNVSPSSLSQTFADESGSLVQQDFCITPNGVHSDLEVVLTPIGAAQPGFDAIYKIVYKNKGNQQLSGALSFTFDASRLQFVSSTVVTAEFQPGFYTFNFADLNPFESRAIEISMHINGPMDTPAVNNNDVLSFTANGIIMDVEETPNDNIFTFDQTVVGSYDPNEITCIEGDVVMPQMIGEYLHYLIQFENTGTYAATNVVVKLEIDPTQYDFSSLRILNNSHPNMGKVTGNIAEFIFNDIFLEIGGHGNILLKLKSKNNLSVGDVVKSKADIFFDYNFPIQTDDAVTTFQVLAVDDNIFDDSVSVSPNPSSSVFKVHSATVISSVQIYDIHGRLIHTTLVKDSDANIDLSQNQKGVYFLKIRSESGVKILKLIRN